MVLGDLKGEYVPLITAMDGQVVSLGPGKGSLNVLDPGDAHDAIRRLREAGQHQLATELSEEIRSRRLTSVRALLVIARGTSGAPVTDREEGVVDAGLQWLDAHHDGVPVLADLLAVVREAPQSLRDVAVDRGDMNNYRAITEDLEVSLTALVAGGRFGNTFNAPTSVSLRHDLPLVFDVSGINDASKDLHAAVLLTCWSAGFATVSVADALHRAGLGPQRHYFLVLDELWRVLRAGHGMVDLVDALTRLNRQYGVAQLMITHTISDLESLSEEEDRQKAVGFISRAGMVVTAGLAKPEAERLAAVLKMSDAEKSLVTSWQSPPSWDTTGREREPAGRAHFLLKVAGRTGIPFLMQLTPAEKPVNDTNLRFSDAMSG
jgi:hypothetical protein